MIDRGGQGSGADRPIVVLGISGQVGWELRRTLAPLGRVVALDHAAADFTDVPRLRETVRALRPSLVVNAVAIANADQAERNPALTRIVNAEAPAALAEEAARLGAPFVHYSSDYVFDGTATTPYTEDVAPAPLNVYGESKLAAERAIAHVGGPFLVFRTSWVYGTRGTNFMRTIRRLALQHETLRVVADQHGTPTWSRAVAEATAAVMSQMRDERGFALDEARWGIYHLSAAGATTWYDFALAVLRDDPAAAEHVCRRVLPITTEEWGAPARRPRYSVLDSGRLRRAFGVALPPWDEQFALVSGEVAESRAAYAVYPSAFGTAPSASPAQATA